MRRLGRTGTAVALTLTLALGVGACSPDADEPDADGPDVAAAALARGLTAGELGEVGFVDADAAQVGDDYADVVEGLGEVTPTVEVGEVSRDDDGSTASASLRWTWPLTEADSWTYDSAADLRLVDGQWRVEWSHSVVEPSLGATSVLETTPIAARRGDVTGAGGATLVTERRVVRVGIDRTQVPVRRAVGGARRLAALVGVDVAPLVRQVRAAGERAFVSAITYRLPDLPRRVAQAVDTIPGGRLVAGRLALAPTREFAAPLLGSVGEVTAEMIDDDPGLEAGDVAGLSGLQARYDDQLQGTPGLVVNAVASDDRERQVFRVPAQRGDELALTLDEGLQRSAESLLADVGPASALVAIRPSTGDILAAANGPGNGGQNLATFGQYAPGSTFKAVSSLALLRSGLTPDSPVPCTATVDVDGRDFENYDDYPADGLGRIPLRAAVANSCNTAFIAERTRLEADDLGAAAAALGLGVDHDLGFPAYFGSVEPATSETGAAADMIGQGTVLASPMAMAAVIASIQAGDVVVPRLVDQVDVSPPAGITPLTAQEDARLREMLRGVVTGGSGALLADVPGPPVIAKTGTAEFQTEAGDVDTHAWMIAAQGDLAVAVFVDRGASGSGTAGPVLEAFLRAAR